MHFKEFISRQRVGIFCIGAVLFSGSLLIAGESGYDSVTGALFIDLAASAVTVILTTLIIDFLNVQEESARTKSAAGLAEDEIKATCFRIKLRMARLLGFERQVSDRNSLRSREQAKEYLDAITHKVDSYLADADISDTSQPVDETMFKRYVERLQLAQTELEQTLILYENAMSYSLRERVLNLRSELQITDHLLGFIDYTGSLSEDNISLIHVMSQSLYEAIETVLEHDSRVVGIPLHAKDSRLTVE